MYLRIFAHSEDSDQPAHSRRLIRIFTVRILNSQGCKVSSCGQRRLWSDSVESQRADLSLRWVQISEGTFSHVAAQFIKHNVTILFCGNQTTGFEINTPFITIRLIGLALIDQRDPEFYDNHWLMAGNTLVKGRKFPKFPSLLLYENAKFCRRMFVNTFQKYI